MPLCIIYSMICNVYFIFRAFKLQSKLCLKETVKILTSGKYKSLNSSLFRAQFTFAMLKILIGHNTTLACLYLQKL